MPHQDFPVNGGHSVTSHSPAPLREFWPGKTTHPVMAAWLGDFVTAVERGESAEDLERGSYR